MFYLAQISGINQITYRSSTRSRAPCLLTTTTNKLGRVQLEAARPITSFVHSTPVDADLAEYKLSPISTCFQTVSLIKVNEWAHFPPADDRRQTLFTPCRQRLKRKDCRNTQSLRLNQLDLNLQVLPLTTSPVRSFPTITTPFHKKMSPSQQKPFA